MKRYLSLPWILVALFILSALTYFFWRVPDPSFRDAAMGNLFATILGIIVGVPIAIELNRKHQEESSKLLREARAEAEVQRSAALFYRILGELSNNAHTLDRLRDALSQSSKSKTEHWEWVLAIADGLTSDAYSDLSLDPPQPSFPWEVDDAIKLAYSMTNGVSRRAREAASSHSFSISTGSDTQRSDKYLGYVSDLAREADRRVNEAVELMGIYKRLYPHPDSK